MMILGRKIIHGHVQNVGLNTNALKLPVGITVTVEKWRIQQWIHGWYLTPVVRYVRGNSNLPVVINVCCFVIQDPVHLAQRWSQQPVTVRKPNQCPEGAVPRSGLAACRVDEHCCVGNMFVRIPVMQEIVSLVHVSVNSGVPVEGRQQRDFVQVLSGSVIRCVGSVCHVAITHVNKFVMLVPVETVLVLGKGPVHVEKQSLHCLVQKMCPHVVIVVTKFWNVASINVHSAVIGVPVKYADRRLKNSVAVESTPSACRVISHICVKPSVLKSVIVKSTSVGGSAVLETVHLVIKSVGGLSAAEITNVLQAATEVVVIHVQRL